MKKDTHTDRDRAEKYAADVRAPAPPVSYAQVRQARLDATANAILPMLAREDSSKGSTCRDAYAWAYALEEARYQAIGDAYEGRRKERGPSSYPQDFPEEV